MARSSQSLVLFRATAGPRRGFGHLVRCGVLAETLGLPCRLALRGTPASQAVARSLGWRLVGDRLETLRALRPALLVIDDPAAARTRPWAERARRLGIPVASIHDVGIGRIPSDLSIDGSLPRARRGPVADLEGPAFAILGPAVARLRRRPPRRASHHVLISLGGGRAGRQLGLAVAERLVAERPVQVAVTAGFGDLPASPLPARCRWVRTARGAAPLLARAAVAVVAGGLTLYEACALGTPAVAVSVVPAQGPAIRAAAAAGALVTHAGAPDADRTAALVVALLDDAPRRARLGRQGRALVDGRGRTRVAAALRDLIATGGHRAA